MSNQHDQPETFDEKVYRLYKQRDRDGLAEHFIKRLELWVKDAIASHGQPWLESRVDDLVADSSLELAKAIDRLLTRELASGAHFTNSVRQKVDPAIEESLDALHVLHLKRDTLKKRRQRAEAKGKDPTKVRKTWERYTRMDARCAANEFAGNGIEQSPYEPIAPIEGIDRKSFADEVATAAKTVSADKTRKAIEIMLDGRYDPKRKFGYRWVCPSVQKAADRVQLPRGTLRDQLHELREPVAIYLDPAFKMYGKWLYRNSGTWPDFQENPMPAPPILPRVPEEANRQANCEMLMAPAASIPKPHFLSPLASRLSNPL